MILICLRGKVTQTYLKASQQLFLFLFSFSYASLFQSGQLVKTQTHLTIAIETHPLMLIIHKHTTHSHIFWCCTTSKCLLFSLFYLFIVIAHRLPLLFLLLDNKNNESLLRHTKKGTAYSGRRYIREAPEVQVHWGESHLQCAADCQSNTYCDTAY